MAVLQVVGGGKMGEALLGGLLAAGAPPSTSRIVEKDRRPASRRCTTSLPGVAVVDRPCRATAPSSR